MMNKTHYGGMVNKEQRWCLIEHDTSLVEWWERHIYGGVVSNVHFCGMVNNTSLVLGEHRHNVDGLVFKTHFGRLVNKTHFGGLYMSHIWWCGVQDTFLVAWWTRRIFSCVLNNTHFWLSGEQNTFWWHGKQDTLGGKANKTPFWWYCEQDSYLVAQCTQHIFDGLVFYKSWSLWHVIEKACLWSHIIT